MMTDRVSQKLLQYAPPPPGGVWDRIADALDATPQFAQRLHDYAATPPPGTWAAVEKSLEAEPAKTVSLFGTYKRPLRYIAAASLIAVGLAGATLLLQNTEETDPITAHTEPDKQPAQDTPISNDTPVKPLTVEEGRQTVAYASGRSSGTATSKRGLAFIQPQTVARSLSLTRAFIPRKASEQPLVANSHTDDLMVYSDGNGMAMKLSKKLFSLVNCSDGDGTCRERIRQLQQKMATNTASSDFAGMIELLRQLQ